MSTPAINKPVDEFSIPATGGQQINLSSLRGKNLVIYFYPKDSTPGCTTQGQNFRDKYEDFLSLDTLVFGVSRDGLQSHENFKAKQSFPFELLCDTEEELCRQFDVIKEKNMYGRKYMGIERSTFLIDKEGILRGQWRKVKVKNHVDEVLQALRALRG